MKEKIKILDIVTQKNFICKNGKFEIDIHFFSLYREKFPDGIILKKIMI